MVSKGSTYVTENKAYKHISVTFISAAQYLHFLFAICSLKES